MKKARTPDWDRSGEAYSAIAERYDDILVENRINRHMRRISLNKLHSTFGPGDYVLEVGCGTGDEALELALRGAKVVALDPSEGLLLRARKKARGLGLTDRVRFVNGRARDLLTPLANSLGSFDGGYASFSLAYEPDLTATATGLGKLLRPDAVFLASLPSRLCLAELIFSFLTSHPSYAGRRLRPWYEHKVGSSRVPIRAYTPHELESIMSPYFAICRTEALPALVPPPYLNSLYDRFAPFADLLERLDDSARTRFPFRYLGDHFLAEFRRTHE